MTLSEFLDSELILLKTKSSSKDDLISELVEQIFATGRELPLSRENILKTINMRELIGGTMLPSGLSVPHARLKGYEGFILALGVPGEPLLYSGIEVRMMALMISSQSGAPWYLPTLAALTKLSRDTEYFTRLCQAETGTAFIDIIRERDQELA